MTFLTVIYKGKAIWGDVRKLKIRSLSKCSVLKSHYLSGERAKIHPGFSMRRSVRVCSLEKGSLDTLLKDTAYVYLCHKSYPHSSNTRVLKTREGFCLQQLYLLFVLIHPRQEEYCQLSNPC